MKPDLAAIRFGEPQVLQRNRPDRLAVGQSCADQRLESRRWHIGKRLKKSFDPFSQYGNLRTDAVFGDGKLTLEFNALRAATAACMSAVREAQVVDRDSKMQGIQGPGAIFSRIVPVRNVYKPGGEWQSYEITSWTGTRRSSSTAKRSSTTNP
ncbi:MAG: hypothetical protein R3F13_09885 [Prosthecobacter sp.]